MSSRLIVNSIRHTGASGDAVSLANDGTCTANITNNLSNRRLTINGAMTIAQRGVSSTSTGYYTVDRFVASWGGTDEACTQEQADVAAGTTPYTLGFRKSFKITNGNQTSTDASDIVYYEHHIEAQDIANSGWNYTSSSSNITLSFWVKSSVSQDFKGYLRTADGTSQIYPYSTGTLSADTWTKVTKTITGNSNLQFDNNNESGLQLYLWPYIGTTYTDAGVTENAWTAYASGTRTPVSATTWWTTNDATIEITGVQLEVGDHATDFEHRSYGQELALCQRYFYKTGDIGTSNEWFPGVATNAGHGNITTQGMDGLQDRSAPLLRFPCYMRDAGTVVFYPGRSGTANTANNINPFVANTLVTTTEKPTAAIGGLEYYFQGTSTDSNAYVFQCTVDSEL